MSGRAQPASSAPNTRSREMVFIWMCPCRALRSLMRRRLGGLLVNVGRADDQNIGVGEQFRLRQALHRDIFQVFDVVNVLLDDIDLVFDVIVKYDVDALARFGHKECGLWRGKFGIESTREFFLQFLDPTWFVGGVRYMDLDDRRLFGRLGHTLRRDRGAGLVSVLGHVGWGWRGRLISFARMTIVSWFGLLIGLG